jgi:hypothetical protein
MFLPVIPEFSIKKFVSEKIKIPDNIKKGDIILARYKHSTWGKFAPWADWHHAALVSNTNPLTLIEAVGPNKNSIQPEGPYEILFNDSVGFSKAGKNLIKMKWLTPVFSNPIREISDKKWSQRKIISEEEARNKVVDYARKQIGEKYKLSEDWFTMINHNIDLTADNASKWDENEWYCSLLIFKAFSRTITNMYLEVYDLRNKTGKINTLRTISSGFFITPDDLAESKRTQTYFTWSRQSFFVPNTLIDA